MPQHDNMNSTQVVDLGTLTLSGTTPSATAWADLRDFNSCTLVIATGTVTDAGTTAGISIEVQEGDDTTAAGATAVADAELLGTEAALAITDDGSDNVVIGAIGYVGDSRYVRVNFTGTTGTAAVVRVLAILQGANIAPPTFVGTSVAAT